MNEPSAPGTSRTATPAQIVTFPPVRTKEAQPRLASKRWLIVGTLILLALTAAGTAWWVTTGEATVQYTTAAVTRGGISRAVTATGTVNPVLTIIVGAYVSGVIQELSCDYNTPVKRGQVCAKIDPRPYQTVADQNKANLAVAKAQLAKDKASLAYAKASYERQARLLQTKAVSQDAFDAAKSAYEQAQAQIEFDEATIQQRQAALDAALVNLDYTNILSPVDGVVVSRNVTMGQTVAASFQTPTLFLIATDLTKMQVDTNVSESDIGSVKEANKAFFTVDAFPKRTFEGNVIQVRQSPQTVQNVVTFDVVVGADNTDLALKPGMTAASRIITDERNDVIRVPNQALRYRPSGRSGVPAQPDEGETGGTEAVRAQLWVVRDGRPFSIPVVTGLEDDSFTEIVQGDVKPGDRVIVGEQSSSSGNRPGAPRLRL